MRVIRTPEFWRNIQGLVERGLSLKRASQQFGVSYSHLRTKAQAEGWQLAPHGRPRAIAYASQERREELRRKELEHEALQAELRNEAEVVSIDLERAEKLTFRVLQTHSAKLKVMLSQMLVQMAEEMRSPRARLRDKAAAVVAINNVGKQLYAWDRESDIHQMAQAEEAGPLANAIDVEFQNTTPEQLRLLHARKMASSRREGSFETVHKDRGDGTLSEQREGPPDGQATQKKEAPLLPAKQTSAQRTIQGNPPAIEQASVHVPPPPLSPQERRKRELEELVRLRAEWRGRSFNSSI
jgi:hypothetical protein